MELLKDPYGNRVVKNLPLPPQRPLATEQIFKDSVVDWRLLRSYLKKEGRITKNDFHTLIKTAISIFSTYGIIRIRTKFDLCSRPCHYSR